MNKRALLNAVVRNIMTKRAALEAKGVTVSKTKQTKPLATKPAAKPEPELDPLLEDYFSMKASGGILDLLGDKYGERPLFEELTDPDGNKSGRMAYIGPSRLPLGRSAKFLNNMLINSGFRGYLRRSIADNAGSFMYPYGSKNHKAFNDAATRFGQYRQLQLQNLGTLKNSLLFAPWAHENAPLVYRKLMNAPKKNRDRALLILKWQVNNRRNKGNGYV